MKEQPGSESSLCWAYSLGVIGYDEALQLQDKLLQERLAGNVPDVILLLQHYPLLTTGVDEGEQNIIASKHTLANEGIEIFHTDRGGNITYHGPGQLVGYPILKLETKGKDVHQYVRNLEEVIIRTLSDFSIRGHRHPKYPGVWVRQEKVCALGIRIARHWCTKHGFALNVNNDLKYFSYIHPCGITEMGVTSMSQLLGHDLRIEDVISSTLRHFSQVFNLTIQERPLEQLGNYCVAETPTVVKTKTP